jgi:hypothetical protein
MGQTTQNHRLAAVPSSVPWASASCRCFKMRSTAGKASRAIFESWGMSGMGIMPMSTKTLEIPWTSCDSHSASVMHSLLILSTCVRAMSSSADRFRLSVGRRLRSSSSASITFRTSKSVSYGQRRIQCSSIIWPRSVSHLDLELEACA